MLFKCNVQHLCFYLLLFLESWVGGWELGLSTGQFFWRCEGPDFPGNLGRTNSGVPLLLESVKIIENLWGILRSFSNGEGSKNHPYFSQMKQPNSDPICDKKWKQLNTQLIKTKISLCLFQMLYLFHSILKKKLEKIRKEI